MKKIINKLSGYIFGIDLDSNLTEYIEKNKKITDCKLLNIKKENNNITGNNSYEEFIKIKDIKKLFKKKKADYTICDICEIKKYLNTFIKDSLIITNDKIYFYGSINYDYLFLEKLYKVYNLDTKITINDNEFILMVDKEKYKKSILKNIKVKVLVICNSIMSILDDLLT